ncbi:hypothetical protein NB640_04020 [Oxalobacter vibrioformis]|uniref:Uncharacterized protein n=1 Tax=Oxalobacter vibrioformis TaxID=933080 RepID=A0A9E9LW39_9BURK|nr:hypothetical protein [Oxalobacter vibrioformis]NLC23341.1 hypothetical protein [Oxalobacter sp.]WAW10820.1 hypothetical protein NB640_04020 [Oxalobacter vibrioformis]
MPLTPRSLLEEYQTTAEDALSREETLISIRLSGMSAMIDAENGLWINEMCMGEYDSIYAQNRIRELSKKE